MASPFVTAWDFLKANPEHQMFSPPFSPRNLQNTYDLEEEAEAGSYSGLKTRPRGTVHPAILGMLERRAEEDTHQPHGFPDLRLGHPDAAIQNQPLAAESHLPDPYDAYPELPPYDSPHVLENAKQGLELPRSVDSMSIEKNIDAPTPTDPRASPQQHPDAPHDTHAGSTEEANLAAQEEADEAARLQRLAEYAQHFGRQKGNDGYTPDPRTSPQDEPFSHPEELEEALTDWGARQGDIDFEREQGEPYEKFEGKPYHKIEQEELDADKKQFHQNYQDLPTPETHPHAQDDADAWMGNESPEHFERMKELGYPKDAPFKKPLFDEE